MTTMNIYTSKKTSRDVVCNSNAKVINCADGDVLTLKEHKVIVPVSANVKLPPPPGTQKPLPPSVPVK